MHEFSDVARDDVEYVPALHGVQAVPGPVLYVPGPHGTQDEIEVDLKVTVLYP